MSTKARRDSSLHWLQTIGALGGDFVIGHQVIPFWEYARIPQFHAWERTDFLFGKRPKTAK